MSRLGLTRIHRLSNIVFAASLIIIVSMTLSGTSFGLQPPATTLDLEAHSSRNIMSEWRTFVEKYIIDEMYGGAYSAVGGNGTVTDSSKDTLFQTNAILFLAGLEEQNPDPQVRHYIDLIASFMVDHLTPGPGGPGTWYGSSDRTGTDLSPAVIFLPSEPYMSYGLLWAYKITGNQTYLSFAKINLDNVIKVFPDARVLNFAGKDISYRESYRMPYYMMWQVTGNETYLDYAKKFQASVQGRNAWETTNANGTIVKLYVHGSAILDEIQYGLLAGDSGAVNEAGQLVEQYWNQHGDDYAITPDSGRDYYQKLVSIDLALWSATGNAKYQDEARRAYFGLLQFWDPSSPYGFWASLAKQIKTCFSRGYPSLVDITAPDITIQNATWQQIRANITDPTYVSLGTVMRGIGVNPSLVYLHYSTDGATWTSLQMASLGNNLYSVNLPSGLHAGNVQFLISASDFFNNTSTMPVTPVGGVVTSQTTEITSQKTVIPPVTTNFSWLPLLVLFGVGVAILALWLGNRYAPFGGILPSAGPLYSPGAAIAPPPAASPADCVLPCRYWRVCQHRHFPICSANNRPYPVDDGRYYCHNCIARNFDWWYQNYGRYKKTVDVFETSYQSVP
jgi:hypothetical protein